MNRFELIAPSDPVAAARLTAHPDTVALAGGVDLLDQMKQKIAAPATLVNLKALKGLDTIESNSSGGVRIGTLVKLSQISANEDLRRRYPAVVEAAGEAATPQIRNIATAGGNLLQRPRCWYFRNPDVQCLKKGGMQCYAIGGLNRYHAILGGGPSFIVHPSNLAPALIAYGATVRLRSSSGERIVELEQFFILPKTDVTHENIMRAGEILTSIELPAPPAGAHGAYLEAREKQSFDWPLASATAVLAVSSGVVREARIVMGAVAPIPWRAPEAEKILTGARLTPEVATRAGDAALAGAAPLPQNGYKVPVAKAMVRRSILRAAGIAESV
ncbi:MAG TPA: FAD binding domain-containing protein [Candidatus Binataceae bacterium]|nr:FAD binding domain-containing protein [Candidatus Binataceae bacterium]